MAYQTQIEDRMYISREHLPGCHLPYIQVSRSVSAANPQMEYSANLNLPIAGVLHLMHQPILVCRFRSLKQVLQLFQPVDQSTRIQGLKPNHHLVHLTEYPYGN